MFHNIDTMMLPRISLWLSSLASVIGFIYTMATNQTSLPMSYTVIVAFIIIAFFISLVLDYRDYLKQKPRSFKPDSNEIKQYLFNWISKGGHAAIFTRDMSWANDARIKNMLIAKARNSELTVILPKPNDLTHELEMSGANIISYEGLDYTPQSRFTIINKDRMDSQVAFGRRIKDQHIIEEFANGNHPVFALANDLVEIVSQTQKKIK
jgi:hypothetical protein